MKPLTPFVLVLFLPALLIAMQAALSPGSRVPNEPPMTVRRIIDAPSTTAPAQAAPPTQHVARTPSETERKGMTWGMVEQASRADVIAVSCHGLPKPGRQDCDAYVGDTDCATPLPLLCLKVDGRPRPLDLKVSFYSGWAAGRIALTEPVQGSAFQTRADADALCTKRFGNGWRVAEHHDGIADDAGNHGGWGFYANGEVSNPSRFWVAINDTAAVCWTPEFGQRKSR